MTGQTVLAQLGENQYLEEDTKVELEEFTCDLYGEVENTINNVHYKVFRKGLLAPQLLAPTQEALHLHLLRNFCHNILNIHGKF